MFSQGSAISILYPFTIFLLSFALACTVVYLRRTLRRLEETKSQAKQAENFVDVQDHLSTYELERLNREKNFDDRINRLKDELDGKQSFSTAEILHPDIQNLPHDAINTEQHTYPREYAE